MSATTGITERILEKAKAKGEELLAEAQHKHDESLQEKLKELRTEVTAFTDSEKKRLREKHQQELSNLRLDERSKTHDLKRRLIDAVYREVWDTARQQDNYAKYVRNELEQHAQPKDVIIVPATDVDFFRNTLKEPLKQCNVTIAEEKGRFRAGFIIPRGTIRLNCSLDERFKDVVQDEEIELAQILLAR